MNVIGLRDLVVMRIIDSCNCYLLRLLVYEVCVLTFFISSVRLCNKNSGTMNICVISYALV